MVIRWLNRTQPQRKAAGWSGLSQNMCKTGESWQYFTSFKYISAPFESFNVWLLWCCIAVRYRAAGSGEAKCHINWAFSATLLLCLHPQSSQLVAILKHAVYIPFPTGATPGLMVWALTNHMSVLCMSPPLTQTHSSSDLKQKDYTASFISPFYLIWYNILTDTAINKVAPLLLSERQHFPSFIHLTVKFNSKFKATADNKLCEYLLFSGL